YPLRIGKTNQRIGANDPNRFNLTYFQGFKHLGRRFTGSSRKIIHAPLVGNYLSMQGDVEVAVRGQQRSHYPYYPTSHGIRLSGEGKGARPGFSDVSGDQVKVDQRQILVHSIAALVQSHRPQGQKSLGTSY